MLENIAKIPVIGWVAIIVITIIAGVIVFLSGLRIKKGEFEIGIGAAKIDNRIKKQREQERKDESLRMWLYRESQEIDAKIKADLRRVVRDLEDTISGIFAPYLQCEFPSILVTNMIKSELFQRIDDNNLRLKFAKLEIQTYLSEITRRIESKYNAFLYHILSNKKNCGEAYPKWDDIDESIKYLLLTWSRLSIAILQSRIDEKIKLYTAHRDKFLLDEYKESSVDEPVEKNRAYLASLEVSEK